MNKCFLYTVISLVGFKPLGAQQNDFMRDLYYGYEEYKGAIILSHSASFYEAPDLNSKAGQRLDFNTPVKILQYGWNEKQQLSWYKTSLENGKQGYVLSKDIAGNSLVSPNQKKQYFFRNNFAGKENGDSIQVFTYDLQKKQFTDTAGLVSVGEGFFRIKPAALTALKNMDQLFRVEIIMPYCGGGQRDVYFADANGQVGFLFSAFSGGDIGDIISTGIWLPVKHKGKTYLASNDETGGLNLKTKDTLSETFKIPLEELVVLRSVETIYELDENDSPVTTEDGMEKTVSEITETIIYRWDGKKLQQISHTTTGKENE